MAQRAFFLIGLRGSGKTTLGQALAKACGVSFADTDDLVVEAAGKSISQIAAEDGWPVFREYERAALRDIAARFAVSGGVVATGGGIVLAPENRTILRQQGTAVFLDVPVSILCQRLACASGRHERPSLSGDSLSPEEEMRRIALERETLYRETAAYTLDASRDIHTVLDDVQRIMRGETI